jgi:hypothetical protein
MKKLILAAFALTTAASVFAQGTISFNNNISGLRTRVYAPLSSNPALSQIGNGSIDTPSGTTSWAGFAEIGAAGTGGQYGGATTLLTFLGAPNTGDQQSSLQAGAGITTFKTGAGGGLISATLTETFANIAPDYSSGATVEMVAWDDSTGLYSTWALASVAWEAGTIAAGESDLVNITSTIGGTINTPPILPNTLESFNLYYNVVPEPATFALAGLGLATLLVLRRRNS